MRNTADKPRLVFFQYKYDEHLPPFLLIHKQEHVQCLSEFFDVTVINHDCDYQQICDIYRPDLALFESGVNHGTCRKPRIANVRSNAAVPKIGLHHGDGFCNARAGFLSDMEHWGIETFFAISTTAAEHTPEIADNLFVWPVFIDDTVYHDYGVWKSVPILFTGSKTSLYPWRQRVFRLLSERYPSLMCPHSGYAPGPGFASIVVGEQYARTINASWFVPACGTIAKEVVRKHFEVPGCNACLITESSPALAAAGFVDMENCIFAHGNEVLDKVAWLFENPDKLRAIISCGRELVHSRHTLKQRDQIFQWFLLQKEIKPNQRLVQLNPFMAPVLVDKSSALKTSHVISDGLHLSLLRQGDEALWVGQYDAAESYYTKCMNYMRWMPEPKVRMALCSLYKGNAKAALGWLDETLQFILAQYEAVDPDPVEWAYWVISLLCLGRVGSAVRRATEYPWLRHPELDRVRWVCGLLEHDVRLGPPVDKEAANRRRSIHRLPQRNLEEWVAQLEMMLEACGQGNLLPALQRGIRSPSAEHPLFSGTLDALSVTVTGSNSGQAKRFVIRRDPALRFRARIFLRNHMLLLKRVASSVLHSLETRYGYVLPYRLSAIRDDEFCKAILTVSRDEDFATVLIIGAAIGNGSTDAILTGLAQNSNRPLAFCVTDTKRRKGRRDDPSVRWYRLSPRRARHTAPELEDVINAIMQENHIDAFDAILIDVRFLIRRSTGTPLTAAIQRAQLVLLDNINYRYDVQRQLRKDASFAAVAENPSLRGGYAIYRKLHRKIRSQVSAHMEAALV